MFGIHNIVQYDSYLCCQFYGVNKKRLNTLHRPTPDSAKFLFICNGSRVVSCPLCRNLLDSFSGSDTIPAYDDRRADIAR